MAHHNERAPVGILESNFEKLKHCIMQLLQKKIRLEVLPIFDLDGLAQKKIVFSTSAMISLVNFFIQHLQIGVLQIWEISSKMRLTKLAAVNFVNM